MVYIIITLSIISLLLFFFLIIYKKRNKNYINEIDNLELEKQKYINGALEEINKVFKERTDNLQKEYIERKEQLSQEYKNYQEDLQIQLEYSKTATQAAKKSYEQQVQDYYQNRKKEIDKDIEKYMFDERAAASIAISNYKDMEKIAKQEYDQILDILEDFRKRREVVNQQVLREKEIQEKTDFYRIQLTENEIEDLKIIKEVESRFNNKEVLHKAAFDCYIRRPLLEMEKRVLNGKKPSGIYIITYIPTGEIYIGKSTDINNRWQEHCKSAYGVGTIAHSSLHTKMARDGIWNFTFQILEEVPKEKLGEREKYWIEQYNATALLNQKQGG